MPNTCTKAEDLSNMGWNEFCPFLKDWIFSAEYFYTILASSKHRDMGKIHNFVA